jgi:hypothetical protein
MRVILYTVNIGGYDKPADHVLIPEIEFQSISVNDTAFNRLDASRRYKMLPHLIPGFDKYDISVYCDGNFTLKNPDLLAWYCGQLYMVADSAVLFLHPDRKNPLEELDEVVRRGMVSHKESEEIKKLWEIYGFNPKSCDLTENGCMIRKHNNKHLIEVEECWWNQWDLGRKRDQVTLQFSMFRRKYKAFRMLSCSTKLEMFSIKRHGE